MSSVKAAAIARVAYEARSVSAGVPQTGPPGCEEALAIGRAETCTSRVGIPPGLWRSERSRSPHRIGARALTVWSLFAGSVLCFATACGRTGPPPNDASASGGDASGEIGCAPFGLQQTRGCNGCTTNLTCNCGAPVGSLDFPPCNQWQRCLRSIDCAAVCAAVNEAGQPYDAIEQVLQCQNAAACEVESDCLNGKCFHDQPSGPGHCSTGAAGSPCNTAADCVGHCVDVLGVHKCEDGDPNQPCNVAGDCLSGICAHSGACGENAFVYTVPPPPTISCSVDGQTCQQGTAGQFCDKDSDCQDGICIVFSGGVGVCQDGSTYSPCKDDGDCKAEHCVYPPAGLKADVPVGWCSSGSLMEPCARNSDCQSGYCYAAPDAVGLCFGGALYDPCTDASQCHSAICVRLDPTLDGTCQSLHGWTRIERRLLESHVHHPPAGSTSRDRSGPPM